MQVMEMRDAIREERTCEVNLIQRPYAAFVGCSCSYNQFRKCAYLQVCLINYKQSGDKFWNQFYLAPVLDENNCVSHYMGIQSDVSHLVDGACQTARKFFPAVLSLL